MKCLMSVLLVLVLLSVSIAIINAYPSTVVVNGVCLSCPNPHGESVYINGEEYRSFDNGNVIINRPGYTSGNGRTTVVRRGGTTVVNGRCEICNVDV